MPSCAAISSVSVSRKTRSAITARCLAPPRPGAGMAADLPPRPPGTCECLGHLVLGLLRAADHGEHRPQAGIPAGLEELGELRLLLAHTRLTPCAPHSAYRRPRNLTANQPRPEAAICAPARVSPPRGRPVRVGDLAALITLR